MIPDGPPGFIEYSDDRPKFWAYTFSPLDRSIELQLLRLVDTPVIPDTITIDVTFNADEMHRVNVEALPTWVLGHVVRYPERPAFSSRCLWELLIEGWTGPRGVDTTECWTLAVTGNNV